MGQAPVSQPVTRRFSGGPRAYAGNPPRYPAPDSAAIPMRDLLAFIQSATEWRNLARMMWTELGKPPISGFPSSRVQQILAGELPPENGFFSALLNALTERRRADEVWRNWPSHSRAAEAAGKVAAMRDLVGKLGSPHVHQTPDAVGTVEGTCAYPTVVSAAEWAVHDAFRHGLASQPLPGRPVLDPSAIKTDAEFMAALRSIKKRVKLSFRSLEEHSRTTTAGWLPRTTAADMLRRDTLPRADTLWAFTAACGLSQDERNKWEAARSRLSAQRRARRPMPSEPTEVICDSDDFNGDEQAA